MGLGLSQGDAPRAPPVWQKLILDPHILREPLADGQGVALWFAGQREGDEQHWERISSVPHAEFTVEPGIIATAAAAVRARQTIRTAWGKFFQRFRGETKGHSWVLPNGETAEQCGERRSDVLLVWADDEEQTLDEGWINSHWSVCTEVRRIGPRYSSSGAWRRPIPAAPRSRRKRKMSRIKWPSIVWPRPAKGTISRGRSPRSSI